METSKFMGLRQAIVDAGYGEEIVWQESVKAPDLPETFRDEYVFVIISSGMKNQIARLIYDRAMKAYHSFQPISSVFKHEGKVEAINQMLASYPSIFKKYQEAEDKLAFLETLPFIGPVTKYHLAKNLGLDVVKPDRHLVRISKMFKTDPDTLCTKLAKETGYRKATVDYILFRAGNLGLI